VSYTATGPAVGPYPGTYRETGTATLERITTTNIGVPIVAFQAEFTIDSAVGRISGTKQFAAATLNYGICNVDTSLGFPVGIHQFSVGATYTARVSASSSSTTPRRARLTGRARSDAGRSQRQTLQINEALRRARQRILRRDRSAPGQPA
jgi:hypothetical protein